MSLQNDLSQTPNLSKNPTHPLPNYPLPENSVINLKSFLSSTSSNQPSYLPTLAKQSAANIIEFLPPETLNNELTFTSRVQDLIKTPNKIKPQTSKQNQLPIFLSMPTQKITLPEAMSTTFRERRLTDIQTFKHNNIKRNNSEDESPHKLKKSSSSGQLARPERCKTRQSLSIVGTAKPNVKRISERRVATLGPNDMSSIALSTEGPRIETEGTPKFASGTDAILSMDSVSYMQPLKLHVNVPKKYEWKEYTDKASSPTFERSTLQTPNKLKRNLSSSMTTRASRSVERLQTIKPFYAQFVTENFKPNIVERLDTLANFGFNTIEKDENVEVPIFLDNTSKMNPGSMPVVDLWSKEQKNKVMKSAGLIDAKRTVKKFLVHCVDKIKSPTTKGPVVGASFESQEGNVKSRIAAKELMKSVNKLQEQELMSPMRRHLSVKNKTFSKDTQSNRERVITSIAGSRKDRGRNSKLVQGIDGIINDLDKLETETQEDYVKVMKFSNAHDAKYPPKELKAVYKMRKLNELLSVGKLKDVKNKDDSDEYVVI